MYFQISYSNVIEVCVGVGDITDERRMIDNPAKREIATVDRTTFHQASYRFFGTRKTTTRENTSPQTKVQMVSPAECEVRCIILKVK